MRKWLAVLMMAAAPLWAVGVWAQSRPVNTASDQSIGGTKTFTEGVVIDPGAFFHLDDRLAGSLPTCNAASEGYMAIVSDGDSTTDCANGGGGNTNLCLCNGSSWTVVSGGGGGSSTLEGLSDTNISATPTLSDILIWDSTDWRNRSVTGDIAIGSTGVAAIVSGKIIESDLAIVDTPAAGECLAYLGASASQQFEWNACGSDSGWTDGGATVSLTTNTDSVIIGTSQINSSRLSIDGGTDVAQFSIQQHSTQTNPPIVVEDSAGTNNLFTVEGGGLITTAVGLDAIGAVDMDYGSADVTDHTFTTDNMVTGGTGEIVLPPQSIDSTEITDDTIVNADINSAAAIATSKLATNNATQDGTNAFSGTNSFTSTGITLNDGTARDFTITFDLDSDQTLIWDESADEFVFSKGISSAPISGSAGSVEIYEDPANGSNKITLTTDGDHADFTYTLLDATGNLHPVGVKSMYWTAASFSADGTQCADPAEVTINSGPKTYTVICADNDASTVYGQVVMPDGWDAGNVTFELAYVQTAADTSALNGDVTAQCRGATEAISSTWGTEVAMDDAALTGSNALDTVTSGSVTPAGTCAAGDILFWRWQMDATGTTTAAATLNLLGMKMEYTTTDDDN